MGTVTTWVAYIIFSGNIYVTVNNIASEQDCLLELRKATQLDTFAKGVCIESTHQKKHMVSKDGEFTHIF